MELELVTDGLPQDENYAIDENFEELSTFESERCGICMDVVIDRGVLDCCQHWFCFTCIDNWATITNLCPLCQIEFQLITCVPVLDTIGGNKTDDDSFRDDDEWSIEGKSNTLSFPSYYIDENAVVCLDGDDCKVRTGLAGTEDVSDLDTSIACDSCDKWYHAFCVGFDPEGTCENSWLCPRCIIADNHSGKLDVLPSSKSHNQSDLENASDEAVLSGKVSVSVADSGETAVVVSLVEGYHEGGAPDEPSLAANSSKDMKDVILSSNAVTDTPNLVLNERNCVVHNLEVEDQELPSSFDKSSDITVGSSTEGSSADISDETLLPEKEDVPIATNGSKRKHKEIRGAEKRSKSKNENPRRLKKAKAEGNGQIDSKDQTVINTLENRSKSSVTVPKDSKLKCISKKESADIDIMDIVQGTSRKPLKKGTRGQTDGMSCEQRENAAGLRMKKIMRRADGEDSSGIVQKLRKDIREAVRSKPTEEIDKIINPKLLAAFRAAVAGSTNETSTKEHLDLKAKQSLLQKGTIRENLTKKIYGIGGRRKRAWTRDCEIEFWKHRCSKTSKPEKIQTLKSVLHLLQDDSENAEMNRMNAEGEPTGSILSRLYLADTSVFPRKDGIKPVSALTASGMSEQRTENGLPANASTQSLPIPNSTVPQNNEESKQAPIPPLTAKAAPKMVPHKKPDSSSRTNSSKFQEGSSSSISSSPNAPSKGEPTKTDKKKWALELLARKASAVSKNASEGNEEDNASLKQNYPLLAQLPKDMRPVLAPSRHNKVPMAIRQAKLYRLTEHFLRKANLPAIRRTAATELAVADAINIEKEVADKSNSKLVYVNLCSQELRCRSDSTSSDKATGMSSAESTEMPSNASEVSNDDHSADPAVSEALINAGLLSDSPPSTPQRSIEVHREENCFSNGDEDDGTNDVFDVEDPPELDIYGDFDYSLEDDFSVANSSMISETQMAEAKLKVIFSTHNPDTSDVASEQLNVEKQDTLEGPKDSSCSVDNDIVTTQIESSSANTNGDNQVPQSSLVDGGGEDLSVAECEELYGPDKEPLVQKYPEMASIKPFELAIDNQVSLTNGCSVSIQAAKSSEQESDSGMDNVEAAASTQCPSVTENLPNGNLEGSENVHKRDKISKSKTSKESDSTNPVSRKVEAYIKEHIRPLCKSGVISVDQYRWAVSKTTEKVMKYHSKDKNANFLIKEGEKVKKLAEQYVEAAQNLPKTQ